MKFKIAYHPVWEQTLTAPEKEKYEQILAAYKSDEQSISTCLVLLKQKRKGGLVATVLICNGSNRNLQIQETIVEIVSEDKDRVANARFVLNLTIPPHGAMPWSFVFSPVELTRIETPNDNWSVRLAPIN